MELAIATGCFSSMAGDECERAFCPDGSSTRNPVVQNWWLTRLVPMLVL